MATKECHMGKEIAKNADKLLHLSLNPNIISEYLVDIYFISAVFIIALADDRYDVSAILRIIALSLVVIFFIYKNNLFINYINSMYWGFYYFPNNIFVKLCVQFMEKVLNLFGQYSWFNVIFPL